jgi:hypothetical protein
MRRTARLCTLAAAAVCTLPMASRAQQNSLAARCDQLSTVADRVLSRRGKGGGGPNMTVMGAGVDCRRGRYEQGIRDLERVLRAQGYTVPPPPT